MSDDYEGAYLLRRPILEATAKRLEARVREALSATKRIDRISFRVKTPDSFAKKARTLKADGRAKYESPLDEIEDQIAGRILVFFRDDLSIVETNLQQVLPTWVEIERKRPEGHSEFGYESDHYIYVIDEHMKAEGWGAAGLMPTTFELQIRTLFMHAFAEPQHDIGYKGEELDPDVEREFAWIAASAWGADKTLNDLQRRFQ